MYEHVDKSDLWQFGFDGGHFKRVKGGREWHGPCPWCGGRDRMVISNGKYWCRQCNKGGSLMSLLKEPPSPEEMARLQEISERKARIQAERDAKEKEAKLKEFNRAKPWVQFHKNLLDRPDILQLLEADGITMQAVER
jgi:DNA primase